jgi:predicted RNase H-like HicB family nuclease
MRSIFGFTFVIVEAGTGYAGYIEELPGAHAEAPTIEETERQLRRAAELLLATNRRFTREPYARARVVRRGVLTVGRR